MPGDSVQPPIQPRDADHSRRLSLLDPEKRGTRLVGDRKKLVARARELVATAGAQVQEAIAGDPEFIRDFCEMLKDGAKERDRTCVNAVLTILKLQGQERVLLVEYVRQLGASSEDEARKAVEAYRGAAGADLLTAIERCTAFLEGALPMYEGHRNTVVRRLGGYLPVDSNLVGQDAEPIPGA